MLYSALALTALFALLWALRRTSRAPGWLFGWYLLLAGAERFLVEFVRAKDDRLLWGFSTAQAVAVGAIAAGVVLIALRRRHAPQPAAPVSGPAERMSLRPQADGSRP